MEAPHVSLIGKIRGQFPARSWRLAGRPLFSLKRLINLIHLKTKRRLGKDISFDPPGESSVPIDVYMPTIEKDAAMLAHSLDYLRKYVKHPITNIYIVGPKDAKAVQKVAKAKGCIFVDETTILGIKKSDVNYVWRDYNKNGWVFKMLLNLAAPKICTEENILVLDADTLFIAPQIFIHEGKPLFNVSDEYHQPYYDASSHILGVKHPICRSFITHYMLFNAKVLKSMHKTLEDRWGKPWDQAIIDNMDRSTAMAFADYESYGDYFASLHPRGYIVNYWSNVSHQVELQGDNMQHWIDLEQSTNMHRSLSFHNFITKEKKK